MVRKWARIKDQGKVDQGNKENLIKLRPRTQRAGVSNY